ncbi:hypothetical protein D6833_00540 [Candidatus Parcubacteria bacterium]|nr:MAG: hypothetical protein D6833_00540 [Candidatus Parcubacteria bacterium]
MGELHRRLASPEIGLRCHFVSAGAQYFWGNRSLPVAVIDAKRRKLLLPRTPDDFDDPKGLTNKRPTKGVFRTAVPVSMSNIDDIIDLVKQVLD